LRVCEATSLSPIGEQIRAVAVVAVAAAAAGGNGSYRSLRTRELYPSSLAFSLRDGQNSTLRATFYYGNSDRLRRLLKRCIPGTLNRSPMLSLNHNDHVCHCSVIVPVARSLWIFCTIRRKTVMKFLLLIAAFLSLDIGARRDGDLNERTSQNCELTWWKNNVKCLNLKRFRFSFNVLHEVYI